MSSAQTLENYRLRKPNFGARLFKTPAKPSRRVLVVDDDLETAQTIKCIIESYGNSFCEIVHDPYDAILALCDRNYDFVFVDQKMPGIEGTRALSQLDKYIDQDPLIAESGRYLNSIPVVLMSGANIELNYNYKLKNFHLVEVLKKKDLRGFLSLNFAS